MLLALLCSAAVWVFEPVAAAAAVAALAQALAERDPSALHNVKLVIEREGYGRLEWLQPVDVSGLDLQDIIQIDRGEACNGRLVGRLRTECFLLTTITLEHLAASAQQFRHAWAGMWVCAKGGGRGSSLCICLGWICRSSCKSTEVRDADRGRGL